MIDEYKVLHGIWFAPSMFVTDDNKKIMILTYQREIEKIKEKFPFSCFVMLRGKSVKNYVEG